MWWYACLTSTEIKYFPFDSCLITSNIFGICSTIGIQLLLKALKSTHKRTSGFQFSGAFFGFFLSIQNIPAA